MPEKTITVTLSESEARGYLPESSGTVSWTTKADADAKLRAALATPSQQEQPRCDKHAWQESLDKTEWVCDRCGTMLPVHGEVGPPTFGCAPAPEHVGEGWPGVTVVRSISGNTPGLPRAYVNELPPISYRQHPEIWECRTYHPALSKEQRDRPRGIAKTLELSKQEAGEVVPLIRKANAGIARKLTAPTDRIADRLEAFADDEQPPVPGWQGRLRDIAESLDARDLLRDDAEFLRSLATEGETDAK